MYKEDGKFVISDDIRLEIRKLCLNQTIDLYTVHANLNGVDSPILTDFIIKASKEFENYLMNGLAQD